MSPHRPRSIKDASSVNGSLHISEWVKIHFSRQEHSRQQLRRLVTHDTGIEPWGRTRFTVLPSGTVVIVGKSDQSDSTNTTTHPTAVHFYKRSAEGWEKLKTIPVPCEHHGDTPMYILGARAGNPEMLYISCWESEVIRQMNVENGNVSVVFSGRDTNHYPGMMSWGDEGEMYVVHSIRGSFPILQLDCSTVPFRVKKSIQTGMETCFSICYIPVHRLIVISSISSIIRAVSCESEKVVWEVKEQVEGVECHTHGMIFSPALDALFVADGWNTWILVLNPWDESLRQVLPLEREMGVIWELCLHNDQLIVNHGDTVSGQRISYFSLQREG